MKQSAVKIALFVLLSFSFPAAIAFAEDSEVARQTLKGIAGVYISVEDLQPNLLKYEKYTKNFDLSKEQIQKDVEKKLQESGIAVLPNDDWQKTPGCPVIYVNINTHENEKYWFAYDVKVELRQVVILAADPNIRTLTATWAMNITGMVNIGNLQLIRKDVGVLVGRFAQAWSAVNKK